MKIGQSASIESVTSEHWRKMAEETGIGWPMLRERMAILRRKTLEALPVVTARATAGDATSLKRLADFIEIRAHSLFRDL